MSAATEAEVIAAWNTRAPLSAPLAEPGELEEIRKRAEAATPGPWVDAGNKIGARSGRNVHGIAEVDFDRDEDLQFVAHAREDIPYLLSLLDAKTREVEGLREALEPFVVAKETERECDDKNWNRLGPVSVYAKLWNQCIAAARAALASQPRPAEEEQK